MFYLKRRKSNADKESGEEGKEASKTISNRSRREGANLALETNAERTKQRASGGEGQRGRIIQEIGAYNVMLSREFIFNRPCTHRHQQNIANDKLFFTHFILTRISFHSFLLPHFFCPFGSRSLYVLFHSPSSCAEFIFISSDGRNTRRSSALRLRLRLVSCSASECT